MYSERMTIQLGVTTRIEPMPDYVLRRPAIPRWWDPVSRPHVAIIVRDPVTKTEIRYFLSSRGTPCSNGRTTLDVSDIDALPEGTLIEVRFNATRANLYRLEMVGNVPCWRWLARSQGLTDFETESISWSIQDDDEILEPDPVVAG
ncbi:MAG: hypothetical protein DRO87_01965 [Candidatus Thorarchaeota archaeon]|nr:MAG: hypothetical protein DRP09_04390 [Candidatus Thorarchaeota archaeon]RLI59728.1 MAG: hypothetical protein DRO87_01965 [Candidatus Thorarchaeota archaeon]